VSIPFGTRNLFIRCSDDKQFGGILRLLEELKRSPASYSLEWTGVPADLSRRRVLRRVLISGHGSPDQAGFELESAQALRPRDLRLPVESNLYLMGCYQGAESQRLGWVTGSGVDVERVWGCAGETESALSTCLLLHLLEDGTESIDRWFPGGLYPNRGRSRRRPCRTKSGGGSGTPFPGFRGVPGGDPSQPRLPHRSDLIDALFQARDDGGRYP
jgi:hypothetical protein